MTITDTTAGAKIFYSINGGAYTAYTGSFSLSTSATISAYASVTVGGSTLNSATVTQSYVIVLPPAVPVTHSGWYRTFLTGRGRPLPGVVYP